MRHYPLSPLRRRVAVGVVAAATLAPATAAESATPCAKPPASPAFAAWDDQANYYLAPGGGFEDGAAGWSLSGGAAIRRGNEPFGLAGDGGKRALTLPPGATATSAPFCIDRDARIVRWVQRAARGGALDVRVVHVDPKASRPGRFLRTARGGRGWRPGPKLGIPLAGTGAGPDGGANVALEFTALVGRWSIDDVFVDPRLRR